MYSYSDHAAMVADGTRTGAYLRALEQTVTPGCVVADIGAGVGIISLFAARLGAGRVYAIEPEECIRAAEEIARQNGLGKRIRFIRDVSTAVTLEEKADIVVSDLHGVLPFFESHLPAVIDARLRLLARDGILIPRLDRVYAAPVEAADRYAAIVGPWESPPVELDLGAGRNHAVNAWYRHAPGDVKPLAPGEPWTTLDYQSIASPDAEGDCQWRIRTAGTLHGFSLWFESELADHVRLSNAPGGPGLVYGAAFFPLPQPVAVTEDQPVGLAITAKQVAGDYVWSWDTTIGDGSGDAAGPRFRQSTFHAAPLSLDSLHRSATDLRPGLEARGRAALRVLEAVEQGRSLEEIAEALERNHAGIFNGRRSAQRFAADLLSACRA